VAAVVVIPHLHRPFAQELAKRVTKWLEANGHQPKMMAVDAQACDLSQHAVTLDDLKDADLAVSLGGDGTMLHAIELLAGFGVPVLGVNVGRVGYLSEVAPDDVELAITSFCAGQFRIEERLMLNVVVRDADGTPRCSASALNDAVVERGAAGTVVRLAVDIGGVTFATLAADGVIIATPTGSTAYNLSARGPVVTPTMQAIVVTPVAPHGLFDRSLVLEPSDVVSLRVLDGRPAALMVDGRETATLSVGESVDVTRSPTSARLVTFGSRTVHDVLGDRLRAREDN
jgi:NAD+ kinase